MTAIFLFLKRNPKLIAIVFAGLIFLALIVYVTNLKSNNKDLHNEVNNLRTDTTFKANEIIRLRYDTAFYRRNLTDITIRVDSLRKADKQRNPGLYDKFPTIEELKRNKL